MMNFYKRKFKKIILLSFIVIVCLIIVGLGFAWVTYYAIGIDGQPKEIWTIDDELKKYPKYNEKPTNLLKEKLLEEQVIVKKTTTIKNSQTNEQKQNIEYFTSNIETDAKLNMFTEFPFIYEPFTTYYNYVLDDNNVIWNIINRKYEVSPLLNCINKRIDTIKWSEIFNLNYVEASEIFYIFLLRNLQLSSFLYVPIILNDNLIETNVIKDTKLNLIDFSSNYYWSRVYIDKQDFIRYDFKQINIAEESFLTNYLFRNENNFYIGPDWRDDIFQEFEPTSPQESIVAAKNENDDDFLNGSLIINQRGQVVFRSILNQFTNEKLFIRQTRYTDNINHILPQK